MYTWKCYKYIFCALMPFIIYWLESIQKFQRISLKSIENIGYQNFSIVAKRIKIVEESGRLRNNGGNLQLHYIFLFQEKKDAVVKSSTWYTTLILSQRDSTFTAINQAVEHGHNFFACFSNISHDLDPIVKVICC